MSGRIVCVGNGVLDQVYEVEALPRASVKTTALNFRESGGGPAATAALAIARLGGSASWWGRVGDDSAGSALQTALKRHGVDLSGLAVIAGARTVRAAVLVDRSGERCIFVDRNGLPSDASCLPAGDLAGTSVLLADSRWPEGSEIALKRARDAGIPRVFDADGGDGKMLSRLAALADHVVFSDEGLSDFVGEGEIEARLQRAAQKLEGIVAVTCGAAGSLWWIDGKTSHVSAFPVTTRDTTGCGDVFHGAYALGLAEGMPPLAAARFASATAAAKAAHGMGWDGMPDRKLVDNMMLRE
ncbi:sugar kinase [Bradyrhizobium lablabi]|uniref:PfkB family carbohydrate kinase n=1 Tax=Bradyrhizobium lablabi TaxID=722472 RepID=UPI001BA75CC1|nr:PfkB family carbohydrate kinase [Bradyrhizobium lablabi]MBR1121901.1 sugar kinase [Bradyrhizobium lablabi]